MKRFVALPAVSRKQMKKLKDVVGFRPKQPMKSSLQDAMDATGCDPASLVEQCVERALPGVVRDILELRKVAAEKFMLAENVSKPSYPARPDEGLVLADKPPATSSKEPHKSIAPKRK